MRYITLFAITIAFSSVAYADPYDTEIDYRFPQNYSKTYRSPEHEARLEQERYETEVVREQARREQIQMQLEAQRQQNEIGAIVRREQEESRRNYETTNVINNVNNAANTASNVARQIKQIGNLMNHGYNPYNW